MKIAVMTKDKTADSIVSEWFARSPYITIYDTETKKYSMFVNKEYLSADKAGIKTAELLIINNIDILLTKEIGTKAYSVLVKEHIIIELVPKGSVVKNLIEQFISNN